MPEAKYLRLDADAVALVVRAFNHSKMSWWPAAQHAEVKDLVRQLGRYLVATAEELNEDFAHRSQRGRPQKTQEPRPTPTLADDLRRAQATLRGAR
jgi:hypothetical protein